MKGRINLDYLKLYQEIPLFCALALSSLFRKKPREKTGGTLIVNTCLIGEFAASLPAIREYIQRNGQGSVDLVVSPPLKPLAEKVRGVRKVYVARSLYSRRNEEGNQEGQTFAVYDRIFVMRISADAYRLIRTISAGEIRTGLLQYAGYAIHLWGSLLHRRLPKQWVEINFEMLGGELKSVPFDDLFQFAQSDYDAVARMEALRTAHKKVIIHTGSSWPMKKWGTGNWVAFLRTAHQLGDLRFIFVGGAEDAAEYASIASQLDFPVYALINEIDLLQLLLVLRTSDYFIGVDSGPRNMAHLADTRSVSIFGPGPHFYMPRDTRDIVLDKSRGRGLFQMFFATKRGFIHDITADEVYEAFKNLLWNS
jgi:ADP-heptose:LPS heptosyltransferase